MKRTWQIDANTAVQFQTGAFGRRIVSINDTEVQRWRNSKRQDAVDFVFPNSLKKAKLDIHRDFLGQVTTELRVDGRLMVQTEDLVKCPACGSTPKSYDTFCASCGKPLAPPEDYEHIRQLKWARNSIKYLGILYAVLGVVFFLISKKPAVLLVYLILAAVMGALFQWSKRAPLAAIVVASATYLVLMAVTALADPRTLAQGIYLKIVIVAALAKGVKSALALRERHA
jgi:zinc ribbon protein